MMNLLNSLELCAGAGGQALGLEQAGFHHLALVEIEPIACETLINNRPQWNVLQGDLRKFKAHRYLGKIDLLAGGVPCPPFSIAGKQLGSLDERDLFPEALRVAKECNPKAILLENVKGLLSPKFEEYRNLILAELKDLGYKGEWKLLNASDFGVSQLRPRAILVALKEEYFDKFSWPTPLQDTPVSIGELLYDQMEKGGWKGVEGWKGEANGIGPTLVGGSKKHGGPDLGPTRAKKAWAQLCVDGSGIANNPPEEDYEGLPKLTVQMAARVQGFPDSWHFLGKKTAAYRQVGNAFPPPVAKYLGIQIAKALQ